MNSKIVQSRNLSIDDVTLQRIGRVLMVAVQHNDYGVADWCVVAISTAADLGKLRDRDAVKLEYLEQVYSNEYYRSEGSNTHG
jgi:hypothetical protein